MVNNMSISFTIENLIFIKGILIFKDSSGGKVSGVDVKIRFLLFGICFNVFFGFLLY